MKKTNREMEREIIAMVKGMEKEHTGSAGYDAIFQTLRGKLFAYVCSIRGTDDLRAEMHMMEIMKAIDDSLKYYEEEKGDFFHYFNFNVNHAMKSLQHNCTDDRLNKICNK